MAHLGDHHVAIESASAVGRAGALNVGTDLGHNGGAKGHVGDKVAVHLTGVSVPLSLARLDSMRALKYNVNVKPCCAVVDRVGTSFAQGSKVGREDRWRDDGRRRHDAAGLETLRPFLGPGYKSCQYVGTLPLGGDEIPRARDVLKRAAPSFEVCQGILPRLTTPLLLHIRTSNQDRTHHATRLSGSRPLLFMHAHGSI